MVELELTRSGRDRRTFALGDLGTLQLTGVFSRSASAEANGTSWYFARRGIFSARSEARDAGGTLVASFEPRGLRRGGTIRWFGRELVLRPASAWRERYALVDGDVELAVLDGKGWGRRPVRLGVADGADLDRGLLLFAAFVVRGLAEDAGSSAAAASTAAVG